MGAERSANRAVTCPVRLDDPNYREWIGVVHSSNLASVTREITALKRMGSRIRQRRREIGLTQEDLADNADLSPHYVSQIEAGRRNPTFSVLFRLSVALELDLGDLVKGESRPASQ